MLDDSDVRIRIDEYHKRDYRIAFAVSVGKMLKLYFSYNTVIAFTYDGTLYKTAHKYSKTTSRHQNSLPSGVTIENHEEFIERLNDCLAQHRLV
jgi:hypothetical protein